MDWEQWHKWSADEWVIARDGKKYRPRDWDFVNHLPKAVVQEYRVALQLAERALMHAAHRELEPNVRELVNEAREEVTRVLNIGRDERNEQTAT